MQVSERAAQGFLLAAAVARDRSAARAEAGLAPPVRAAWLAPARRVAALRRPDRRRTLATIARPTTLPDTGVLGPSHRRALCLLAARATPELGRAWLTRGPLPRPGYVAEPALLQLLHRIAQGVATARATEDRPWGA